MQMKRIFKYPIKIENESQLIIPVEAKILSVMEQNGGIVLYATVNTGISESPTKIISIRVRGTGHIIDFDLDDFEFLGTVSTHGGQLMWHIFYQEVKNE